MKKSISLFLSFLLLLSCAVFAFADNSVKNKKITLDFSFGTRSGKYTGQLDENGLPVGVGTFSAKNSAGETWTC